MNYINTIIKAAETVEDATVAVKYAFTIVVKNIISIQAVEHKDILYPVIKAVKLDINDCKQYQYLLVIKL